MDRVSSIQVVGRLTGLSPSLIRAWEQRYGAVEPDRTSTKRRLYSHSDIERLRLLKKLTDSGHAISQIAKLPDAKLRELTIQSARRLHSETSAAPQKETAEILINEALVAIETLDARRLADTLENSAAALGTHGSLLRVISPLAESVGELWRAGRLSAAHEHFGSSVMRDFLHQLVKPFGGSDRSPAIIVATPAGQLHELGAAMAAATAAHLGWKVTYLGASLPAAEIAGAGRQKNARAVALSLIYPDDDPFVASEVTLLKQLLPADVALILGGRAAPTYWPKLKDTGAMLVQDLTAFGHVLDETRRPGPQRAQGKA
jgi:MerR family transcriptional regulator, light-induced transcriptional regulator